MRLELPNPGNKLPAGLRCRIAIGGTSSAATPSPPTKAEEYRRMKPRVALLSCTALLLLPGTALADTLQQALEAAYKSNPTLTAQRANVRAADENVPIARAAGPPSLEGSAVYQANGLQGDQPPTLFTPDPTNTE